MQGLSLIPGAQGRGIFNEVSSWTATLFGIPGFYAPRLISPFLALPSSPGATSFYDTSPLRDTLNELVDFDLLNKGATRLSVGTVNVRTGNFRYFDSTTDKITVDHIMASGALPPGFPPVMIEGEYYWDGGLVSNTPLYYVVDVSNPNDPLCIFQVDLFLSMGQIPNTILEAIEREKEIRFSSRTRMNTAAAMAEHKLHAAAMNLLKKLPPNLLDDADVKLLQSMGKEASVTVMHLIKRSNEIDSQSTDYEFSRLSVEEHWAEGHTDVIKSMASPAWKARKIPAEGMVTFDHGKVVQS